MFHSLGDTIQLCEVAIRLGRAVGVGGGVDGGESSKEYQELRHDLDIFVQSLTQVIATHQQYENSPALERLNDITKSVVDTCALDIQRTLDLHQSKYHSSLKTGGSGNNIRDAYRSIQWSLIVKDQLQILRKKLQFCTEQLSMLTNLAARVSARIDNTTLLSRIRDVQQLVSERCQNQEEVLRLLQNQHASSKKQADNIGEISRRVDAQERRTQSLLNTVGNISASIGELRELPLIIEDALGRKLPIASQWLESLEWETLNSMLSGAFKGQKGFCMVQNGQYLLEDAASKTDLDKHRPLHLSLRRGMHVNMSMVFERLEITMSSCPRCSSSTDAVIGMDVQCRNALCGMWFKFQRVGIEGERHGETGRVVSRTPGATSLTVVPADFQRVRLLDPLLEHTTQQANDQSHLPLPGYSSAFRCLQGHSNLEFKYGDPGIFWPHSGEGERTHYPYEPGFGYLASDGYHFQFDHGYICRDEEKIYP